MSRFYCEVHNITHEEGECPLCAMEEAHRAEEAEIMARVAQVARMNAVTEYLALENAQFEDKHRAHLAQSS